MSDSLPQYSLRVLIAGVKAGAELLEEERKNAGPDELPAPGSEADALWTSIVQYVGCMETRRQAERDRARREALRARICAGDGDEDPGRCAYRFDLEFADGLNDGPRCILAAEHVGAHTCSSSLRSRVEPRYGRKVADRIEAAARSGALIVAPDDMTIEEFARTLGASVE